MGESRITSTSNSSSLINIGTRFGSSFNTNFALENERRIVRPHWKLIDECLSSVFEIDRLKARLYQLPAIVSYKTSIPTDKGKNLFDVILANDYLTDFDKKLSIQYLLENKNYKLYFDKLFKCKFDQKSELDRTLYFENITLIKNHSQLFSLVNNWLSNLSLPAEVRDLKHKIKNALKHSLDYQDYYPLIAKMCALRCETLAANFDVDSPPLELKAIAIAHKKLHPWYSFMHFKKEDARVQIQQNIQKVLNNPNDINPIDFKLKI